MQNMKKKIRVGIIGAGNFAQINHIPCLLSNSLVEIPWVFDKNKNQSRRIESMYGLNAIDEMQLESKLKDIDMALLTVPYGSRDGYYDLLSKNEVAVYVEKPFARSIAEHKIISNYFDKSSLAVGFNRRFYKNHLTIKEILCQNIFGKLNGISIRQGYFSISGGSGFRSNAKLSGGGVLIESGIHLIDAALFIIDPINTTVRNKKVLHDLGIDYHTEASGDFILSSGRGVSFSLEISTLQNFKSGIWFDFENAKIHCPMDPGESISVLDNHGYPIGKIEWCIGGATTVEQSLSMAWADFINSYLERGKSFLSEDKFRLTSDLLEQIYVGVEL